MLKWFGCFVFFLSASHSTNAQRLELYWDEDARSSRVVSFGVIPSTIAVQRRVVLTNVTGSDVFVRTLRLNRQGVPSPIIDEFLVVPTTPTRLVPRRPDTVYIDYNAGQLPQFADTLVDVDLVVQVLDTLGGPVVESHTFRLLARKTLRALGTLNTWMSFDSVYVNASCAKRDTIPVSNLSTQSIGVVKQNTRVRTTYLGQPEIIVDTFPKIRIAERTETAWRARYQPLDRGRDSADFVILYANPDNPADTVHVIEISGVGVEQQMDLVGVRTVAGDALVARRGADTIDIRKVAAGSAGATVAITVANEGNVDVGVDSVRILEKGLASSYLTILRPLSGVLPVGGADTMVVRFAADAEVAHLAELMIYTNIDRRGYACVPDTARVRTFVISARSTSIYSVSPEVLELDPLTTRPECTSRRLVGVFEVRNTSTTEAVIDSVTVTPPGVALRVTPTSFTLVPGGMVRLEVELSTGFVGTTEGLVTLWSSAGERRRTFRIRGRIIAPDTVSLELPANVSARPGSVISVPVICRRYDRRVLRSAVLDLRYNAGALRLLGVTLPATAAESATEQVEMQSGRGLVRLSFRGNPEARDTLLLLTFETYLADSTTTSISIRSDSTVLGTADCPDLYPVIISDGVFRIDSVCGLSYKTANVRSFLAGILPNPTDDQANITLAAAVGTVYSIDIVDALGRRLGQTTHGTAHEPLSIIRLDVSRLPPATYSVRVSSNSGVLMIPLVVQR